ncbi:ribose-phosphate diphosphokinase [Nanoarchaeota archaeon]
MKKIVFGLSNSGSLAKSIAKHSNLTYSQIKIKNFPDGELYLRFIKEVKGKEVFLVQSLYPNPNKSLLELLLAIKTAKDLGAKKVHVFVPYLAFMRQDKRFNPGEAVSSRIMAKLLDCADSLTTIDPHLHRIKKLNQIFKTKTKVIHATSLLARFIKKSFPNHTLIGPDIESHQWVSAISKEIGFPFFVLRKERFSSRKVKISMPKFNFKDKKVVIIDDVVSTGYTIAETAKLLKKKGASSISLVCVHGIFVENALSKLKKAGVDKIFCTNTIQSKKSSIDASSLFKELI